MNQKTESDLPKLSAPAQRALAGAGIQNLRQLSKFSESEIKKLHGIGPNALNELCWTTFRQLFSCISIAPIIKVRRLLTNTWNSSVLPIWILSKSNTNNPSHLQLLFSSRPIGHTRLYARKSSSKRQST